MSLLGSPFTSPSINAFDTAYPDNPWAGITTKERIFYDPVLREIFRQNNVYARYATFVQNLANRNAKTMNISEVLDIHPNNDQLGLRDIYLPASHVDSRSLDITFARYGGKVAYHVYDEIITYWQTQGGAGSLSAIRRIVQDKLGQHMVDVQDLLARNAFLGVPFALYADGASGFNTLTPQSKMSTAILNEIQLGMQYRNVPGFKQEDDQGGDLICITSPGVIFDIQTQTNPADWLVPKAYGDPSTLLKYEIGTYRNVRFIRSPKATLFNCGDITIQTTVTSPILAGDGSPDPASTKVDSTYKVGQPAATHYIQLDAGTDMTQFAVNDIVTIHLNRTSAFGVTNGVDYREGTLHNRRIAAIDAGNHRLSFVIPIMVDMNTDLGGGVYAYVTKGVHIHSSTFIGGNDGIVMGVGRPPRLHFPAPVDDFDAMFRFSWDSYQGYLNYRPEVLEVFFSGGSFREVGPMLQG